FACRIDLPAHQPDRDAHHKARAHAPGEIAVRRAAQRDDGAAALHQLEGVDREGAAERVVDDVVAAALFEILLAVIGNDLVGAERLDEIGVLRARGRGDVQADGLRVLARAGAGAAGAGARRAAPAGPRGD